MLAFREERRDGVRFCLVRMPELACGRVVWRECHQIIFIIIAIVMMLMLMLMLLLLDCTLSLPM